MSVPLMRVASLAFCLCLVTADGISPPHRDHRTTPETPPADTRVPLEDSLALGQTPDTRVPLEDSLALGQATLNEMFREVEMLMEDTQHILEEAVDQMINESAKSLHSISDLPLDYHNETSREDANHTVTVERMDMQTDNITGQTHFSRSHIKINGEWNEVDHECMVDEDCDDFCYCLYEVTTSRCLPCKDLHTECIKDEECCSEQQCVWGQCAEPATRGSAGTICQAQSDCRPGHCCAFHKDLLFPVCTPRPGKGEACHSHPNLLMDMLAWDLDGPMEYCSCDTGLHCQPHGRGSLCVT